MTIKRVYFRFEDYLLFDPGVTFGSTAAPAPGANKSNLDDENKVISEEDEDEDDDEEDDKVGPDGIDAEEV